MWYIKLPLIINEQTYEHLLEPADEHNDEPVQRIAIPSHDFLFPLTNK